MPRLVEGFAKGGGQVEVNVKYCVKCDCDGCWQEVIVCGLAKISLSVGVKWWGRMGGVSPSQNPGKDV